MELKDILEEMAYISKFHAQMMRTTDKHGNASGPWQVRYEGARYRHRVQDADSMSQEDLEHNVRKVAMELGRRAGLVINSYVKKCLQDIRCLVNAPKDGRGTLIDTAREREARIRAVSEPLITIQDSIYIVLLPAWCMRVDDEQDAREWKRQMDQVFNGIVHEEYARLDEELAKELKRYGGQIHGYL